MIEKSPRNRQLDSKEEKAKNQYLFHTINGQDHMCRMNMPIIDVPKEGVPYLRCVVWSSLPAFVSHASQ
jgi:hypothetical protein